jgi:hypothetical protein
MRAFVSALLTVVILGSTPAAAQTGRPAPLPPNIAPARTLLRELIQGHPREEIRTELNGWIIEGSVFLAFQSDKMPPELGVELVRVSGKFEPTLVVNPTFLMTPVYLSLKSDLAYKRLVIYYVYAILKNHLSGKLPLRSADLGPNESLADRAEHLWQVQYQAYLAEWKLAKELKVEYLMDPTYTLSRQYGEELGILEGFAAFLVSNGSDSFKSLFEAIHRREVAKLKYKT